MRGRGETEMSVENACLLVGEMFLRAGGSAVGAGWMVLHSELLSSQEHCLGSRAAASPAKRERREWDRTHRSEQQQRNRSSVSGEAFRS